MWGRGVYFRVSHASHPKRTEFHGFPILGVLQIRHGNAYREGREVSHAIAFAQMRRAVCQRQLNFLFLYVYDVRFIL